MLRNWMLSTSLAHGVVLRLRSKSKKNQPIRQPPQAGMVKMLSASYRQRPAIIHPLSTDNALQYATTLPGIMWKKEKRRCIVAGGKAKKKWKTEKDQGEGVFFLFSDENGIGWQQLGSTVATVA
uniref:Uncharacterized protein n=1 Tax=Anopheles melas TaxID=34690 RepID=A0A182UIM8_9DIPT